MPTTPPAGPSIPDRRGPHDPAATASGQPPGRAQMRSKPALHTAIPLVLGSGRRLCNDGVLPATMRPAGLTVTGLGIVIGSYEPAGPVRHGQMSPAGDCLVPAPSLRDSARGAGSAG